MILLVRISILQFLGGDFFDSIDPERTCVPNRTLFDADLMNFREVEVRREWRNIDILIDLRVDGVEPLQR